MTPVIPSPTSNICLIPGAAFPRSKSICLTRCYDLRKYTKQTSYAQDLVFPLSTSVGLFPRIRTYSLNRKSRIQIVSATGTDIVEEPESPLADKDNGEALGISSLGEMHEDISSKAESTRTQAWSKHSRYVRKSEMPPVKNDEVVPGEALGISSIVETHEGMSIKADSTRTQAQSKRSRPISKSEMPPVKNEELVPGEALGISSVVEETHENISSKADSTRTQAQSKRSRPVSKSEMPPVKNEGLIPGEALGISSVVEETHENISSTADSTRTQARPKRSRPVRKSEMPPVKNEALVPGATFIGKVRSIPPFGAFVDFGAFTDGLVHVSNLSDSFVKDVRTVVSVGQEVKVRLVEANFETGRISLTMRESDEMTKQPSDDSDKTRPSRKNSQKSNQRRDEGKRMSKFVKGQNLEGKVKSLTRTGALISLPDGEEGYLPAEEEADDGLASIMGSSTLKVDQEVSVRVLQINRGKVTLTMRKEEDVGGLESKLTGTVYTATNAFVFAFRKNKEIASFLDEIEKEKESKGMTGVLSAIDETVEDDEISQDEVDVGSCATIDRETSAPSPVENEDMSSCPLLSPESEVIEVVENQIDNTSANDELLLQTPTGREIPSAQPVEDNNVGVGPTPMQNGIINNSSGESSAAKAISPNLVSRLRSETGAGIMDCFNALSETGGNIVKAQVYLKKKGLASADKKSSRATMEGRIGSYIHDAKIGVLVEANCETDIVSRGNIFKELVDDLAMQVAACPRVQYINTEDVPKGTVEKEREIEMQREDILSKPEQIRAKIIEGRIRKRLEDLALLEQPYIKNDKIMVKDIIKQTIALIGEDMKVKRFVRFDLGEGLEKKSKDFTAKVAAQTAAKQAPTRPKEQPTKSSWPAAEGRIGSYIHDSHIGVLIEVICETEFVGRSNEFKELADSLAMQVAVSSQLQFVSIDDIPAGILGKEKEEEMHREDILSQPENIRDKVVKLALLEQPFVRDDKILVKDLVKLYADVLGEKVKVRRFVRFTVGEQSDANRETRA